MYLHPLISEVANLSAAEMLMFVREHGLEGVVAKRTAVSTNLANERGFGVSIGQSWSGVRDRRIRAEQSRS
jgi:hypothetical protein